MNAPPSYSFPVSAPLHRERVIRLVLSNRCLHQQIPRSVCIMVIISISINLGLKRIFLQVSRIEIYENEVIVRHLEEVLAPALQVQAALQAPATAVPEYILDPNENLGDDLDRSEGENQQTRVRERAQVVVEYLLQRLVQVAPVSVPEKWEGT